MVAVGILAVAAYGIHIFLNISTSEARIKKFTNVDFSSQVTKDYYTDFIRQGFKQKEFDYFVKAFNLLAIDYDGFPVTQKRQVLEKIGQYLEEKYPEQYAQNPLPIPCREQNCGAQTNYSPELLELKKAIEASLEIDDMAKAGMLKNLEDAAFAAGENSKDRQVGELSIVFFDLKEIWQNTKSQDIKSLAKKVLETIEAIDPLKYRPILNEADFKLE